MNSDKRPAAQRGNAMIYILLAIALLAALTMTMMRGNDSGGDDLSKDEAELLATQVIAYAGSAKQVVDNMVMSGSPPASLDFSTPNSTSFNLGSNIHKVYHPAGGGLTYQQPDPKIFPDTNATGGTPGWYISFNQVEWTPTTALDPIIAAHRMNKSICESINKKITGSTAIPVITTSSLGQLFLGASPGWTNSNALNSSECAACAGHHALCVSNPAQNFYTYYNILSAQ